MPNVKELTDYNPDGTRVGQSASDKLGFFGLATPVVQPTNALDVVAALQALGLLASGTYTITGVSKVSTNETGTTGTAGLAASGYSSANSTAAKTFQLNPPTAGVEKVLYTDVSSTAIVKVQLNSTALSASGVTLRTALFPTSGASLGMVVFDQTTTLGGHCVTLVGISSTEWMLKGTNINSTVGTSAITFTT